MSTVDFSPVWNNFSTSAANVCFQKDEIKSFDNEKVLCLMGNAVVSMKLGKFLRRFVIMAETWIHCRVPNIKHKDGNKLFNSEESEVNFIRRGLHVLEWYAILLIVCSVKDQTVLTGASYPDFPEKLDGDIQIERLG